MKFYKDENIASAIEPGWLVKYEIAVAGGNTEYRFSEVWKTDDDELIFDFGDYSLDVIDDWSSSPTRLDSNIVAVYKLSKRGNYIKVWEK